MLLSAAGGGDRPTSPAPLTGCPPGPARRGAPPPLCGPSARHPPRRWGRRTGEEPGLRLSPARLPLRRCRRGNGQVSASSPHFCPARRGGCLRSVVTCHRGTARLSNFASCWLPRRPPCLLREGECSGLIGFAQREAGGGWGGKEGSRSAERSSALLGGGGLSEPCAPPAARRPSPERATRARRRGGRPAERSWRWFFLVWGCWLVFFLPWREPAGPAQQAPSRGGRAGGRAAGGASPAGVGRPASPSGPLAFQVIPLCFRHLRGFAWPGACGAPLLARGWQPPPGGAPAPQKEGNLPLPTREGWGVSAGRAEEARWGAGGASALPAVGAPRGAGGRRLRGGARAPGRWSRGERRRRRRRFISA